MRPREKHSDEKSPKINELETSALLEFSSDDRTETTFLLLSAQALENISRRRKARACSARPFTTPARYFNWISALAAPAPIRRCHASGRPARCWNVPRSFR